MTSLKKIEKRLWSSWKAVNLFTLREIRRRY